MPTYDMHYTLTDHVHLTISADSEEEAIEIAETALTETNVEIWRGEWELSFMEERDEDS